jgi:hypothetical protein
MTANKHLPMLLAVGYLTAAPASLQADSPPFVAEPSTIGTWSGAFEALNDPDASTFTVYRRQPNGRGAKLWGMKIYAEGATYLADDGEHVAVGYWGGELVPFSVRPDQPMISFYRRDRLIGAVSLSELVRDYQHLPRGVSHYRWGDFLGFYENSTRFAVQTKEGRYVILDAATGKIVETRPLSDRPKELDERGARARAARDAARAPQPKRSAKPKR